MRISTPYLFENYTDHIGRTMEAYAGAQERVLTGKRFQRASEDPGAAAFVVSATALKARFQRLDDNLRTAKDYLGNTEQAFTEIHDIFKTARTLAVSAANGTQDGPGRQAMATQIAQLQERLVDLGNTQGASGQFIFAGQESDTKPFSWNPPTLTFSGDDLAVTIEAKPGEAMVVNVPQADDTFDRLMTNLENFRQALLGGDASLIGERDLKALQASLEEIGLVRASVGTRLQSVDALHDRNVQRMDELTRQVSDAQDIDLAKAMTDLKSAETAYQAALQVASQGFQLSLMDFIR